VKISLARRRETIRAEEPVRKALLRSRCHKLDALRATHPI
jgi:hypothetical protein